VAEERQTATRHLTSIRCGVRNRLFENPFVKKLSDARNGMSSIELRSFYRRFCPSTKVVLAIKRMRQTIALSERIRKRRLCNRERLSARFSDLDRPTRCAVSRCNTGGPGGHLRVTGRSSSGHRCRAPCHQGRPCGPAIDGLNLLLLSPGRSARANRREDRNPRVGFQRLMTLSRGTRCDAMRGAASSSCRVTGSSAGLGRPFG
jgi:hypothetical protein